MTLSLFSSFKYYKLSFIDAEMRLKYEPQFSLKLRLLDLGKNSSPGTLGFSQTILKG